MHTLHFLLTVPQLQQAEAHVLQAEEDIRDEVVSEIQEVGTHGHGSV